MYPALHPASVRRFLVLWTLATLSLTAPARAQASPLGISSLTEGPTTGSDSVLLTASSAWTASTTDSWLHLAAGSASGKTNATVIFRFDANTGATRMGTITIAGQMLTITQAGSSYAPANFLAALITATPNAPAAVAVDNYVMNGLEGRVVFADTGNSAIKVLSVNGTITTLVSTGLDEPYGVAADPSGNVYIADTYNNAIKVWTAATQAVTTLVSTGLNEPSGIVIDGNTPPNIYIADYSNNAVKEYVASTQTVVTLVAEGLNGPAGVAVDGSGNVYIADSGHNAIKMYSPSTGKVTTLVATGLNFPQDVALDAAGNVYIADSGNYAVKAYSVTTNVVTTLKTSFNSTNVNFPSGLAVDSQGNVFIADTGNNAIEEYEPAVANGQNLVLVPGLLDVPNSLAVDGSGNVYIADSGNNAVEMYSPATQKLTTVLTGIPSNPAGGTFVDLFYPSGVAADGSGNLYIVNANSSTVLAYAPGATDTTTLVSAGANNANLRFPSGLALDSSGNVYIADSGHNAIKEYNASTQALATLVSTGLDNPTAVAVDHSGNVYIADSGHNAIKMYNASTHAVSTLVSKGLYNPSGVAVDGGGNVYIADSYNSLVKEYIAATKTVFTLPTTAFYNPHGVTVDGSGNLYIADTGSGFIYESPRAFLDPTNRFETDAVGSDSLPPVLPASTNLLPPFAPASDQSWLTIGTISGGAIPFSFTLNSGAPRVAHITLFGQSIAVGQGLASPNPIAVNDTAYANSAAPIMIDVVTNDSSPEGDFLTITAVSTPGRGKAAIDYAANTIIYTPKASFAAFAGTDSFTYTISDSHGGTATATVTVSNPFLPIKGRYDGLVSPSGGGNADGYLTLSLGGAGSFTGALDLAGLAYSFTGAFGLTGTASVTAKRAGSAPISLMLALALPSGASLSAAITAGGSAYSAATGPLEPYNGSTSKAPSADKYTAYLPSPGTPQGNGWATMTISASGAVTLAGKLGDATKFSFGGFLSHGAPNDAFALYVPLYSGLGKPNAPGSILGTVTVVAGSGCSGSLAWVKPAQTTGKLYPAGFNTSVNFNGSVYTAPVTGPVAPFTTTGSPTCKLSSGNLASSISIPIAISAHNAVSVTGANTYKLTLKLTPSNGTFTGTAAAGAGIPTSAISGVILQGTYNEGAGLFLGSTETGAVTLSP